jgi:hypothetical protein
LNDLHITEKKVVEDMLAETHRRLTEANNTHSS